MIRVVDSMLTQMTDAASNLGAIVKTHRSMQEDFVANLMDSIDSGIGRLVDADMNEESTRLKALQTQQQLGIQSLSIANNNSENILALFR
jgi:flagellin